MHALQRVGKVLCRLSWSPSAALTSCSLPSLQGILPIDLSCRLLARKVAPARKILPFLKGSMIHAYMNRSKLSIGLSDFLAIDPR